MTELIVHESQEAIFFANGQIADVFGPGRYKLKYPLPAQEITRLTQSIIVSLNPLRMDKERRHWKLCTITNPRMNIREF